jgi:hypothetical protein
MTGKRRQLSFTSVGDVPPDVDRLLRDGHLTVGRWTLAQICAHLSDTLEWSLDGFPARQLPWVARATFGKLAKWNMFRTGRIPENFPLPKRISPPSELLLDEQVARLNRAVARFQSHQADHAPHPFIGPMSHADFERYHCIHAAHHLSFAIPTNLADPPPTARPEPITAPSTNTSPAA